LSDAGNRTPEMVEKTALRKAAHCNLKGNNTKALYRNAHQVFAVSHFPVLPCGRSLVQKHNFFIFNERFFVSLSGFEPELSTEILIWQALNALPYFTFRYFGASANSIRQEARSGRHHPTTPRLNPIFYRSSSF